MVEPVASQLVSRPFDLAKGDLPVLLVSLGVAGFFTWMFLHTLRLAYATLTGNHTATQAAVALAVLCLLPLMFLVLVTRRQANSVRSGATSELSRPRGPRGARHILLFASIYPVAVTLRVMLGTTINVLLVPLVAGLWWTGVAMVGGAWWLVFMRPRVKRRSAGLTEAS